eukprot:TRINITY_DN1193_c0_g1_i8.p1 TRINITY_DN1193_c0_g1~~TRINITY_DN1193_c0_g1_i8.p1  ORF type:complete len:389 (+),score=137.46 TRINITY_DN1193_c0_g1_i8:191-1357(+)
MQALEKINESGVDTKPDSALQFDETPSRCQCWDKKWFPVLVIFSWIVMAGLIALTIVSKVKWDECSDNYFNAEKEYEDLKKRVVQKDHEVGLIKVSIFEEEEKIRTASTKLNGKLDELKKLTTNHTNLEAQLKELKHTLNVTQEKHQKLKTQNDNFQANITEKEEKVKKLTETASIMKKDIVTNKYERQALEIPTYVAGGLCVVELIYNAVVYFQLLAANSELDELRHYDIAFEKLARDFENYEIFAKHKHRVERVRCSDKKTLEDIKNCANKGPTITAITTEDGYRFGAVLNVNWGTDRKNYEDPRAYTFSDTVGLEADINDGHHAMIVGDNLVQFGETDIVVAKDTTGTAVGKTYTVPEPYNYKTFYYNGTFTVRDLHIDTIKVAS